MGELGHKPMKNPGLPKGRTVDAAARQSVMEILGDAPLRRDLLLEHIHRLQDHYGCLSVGNLTALAEVMNLPMAEVYEVASFYAHFDIVRDDETPPPPVTVRLCGGPSCCMAGAETLADGAVQALPEGARLQVVPCIGRCDQAPAATVTRAAGGHLLVDRADVDRLVDAAARVPDTPPALPRPILADYRASGGYTLWQACVAGQHTPESVIDILDRCQLRGCGGAGFPTAQKWRAVRSTPGPRLMVVNADEGEPGTFKDRFYLAQDPHRMLEGMLIAAWAVEAEAVTIYLRDEYPDLRLRLLAEIDALAQSDLPALPAIHLRRGAGSYVCGEESAMIESIEGKRGLPRLRPPYVAERGLFDRPTLVNNVETLYWVRDMVEKGPDAFLAVGRRGCRGWRSFSVSGRVRQPGVKLAPAGISVRELIDELCGGMLPGHRLAAYLPGGASGGIFSAEQADLPLDFGTFEPLGGFLGSAAVIILSDQDDVRDFARRLMDFFAHESCGQCTPCRVGTEKAAHLLRQERWDAGLLGELSRVMQDASICGLGQAAPNAWETVLRHFAGKI
jgi:formate dehydrogenase beta subunit